MLLQCRGDCCNGERNLITSVLHTHEPFLEHNWYHYKLEVVDFSISEDLK